MKKNYLVFTFLIFYLSISTVNGQSWLWGAMGITTSETYAAATDNKGNAFLGGYFQDSAIFGSKHLTSLGADAFLVKYDSSGNIKWTAQSKITSALAMAFVASTATDNDGNVYVTGWFTDTAVFGADTLIFIPHNGGYTDCFLVKYDVNGNVLWARQADIPSTFNATGCNPYSVATDNSGNIYVTGSCGGGPVYFGTDTLNTAYGACFLVKYDSSGTVLWARQSQGIACGNSVATDNAGNAYITGTVTSSTVSFGPDTLANKGLSVFLAKYNTTGNVLWAKEGKLSNTGAASANSVACDKTGNAYVTGALTDTLIFGMDTLKSRANGSDMFLVKYNSVGNVLWAKGSHGDSGTASGYSVAVDSLNHAYLSSAIVGRITFGKATFSSSTTAIDASLIMQLDSSGNVWCGAVSAGGGDDNNTIATDLSGKYVYWGGDIYTTTVFGKDTLKGSGSSDESPFIARWQPCDYIAESVNQLSSVHESVVLFPNPNNGKFTISINDLKNKAQINIYNVLGMKVKDEEVSTNNTEIDLSSQSNGIYFYRIISEKGNLIGEGKLIKE